MVWPNSMTEADFRPNIETLRAIEAQQTANMQYTNLPDQADVKITWINNCDITPVDCEDACSFTGESADTYVKTMQIDQCKEVKFSEPIDAWRGNYFGLADAISVNLIKAQKSLAEVAAQYCIGVINSNAGVNTLS